MSGRQAISVRTRKTAPALVAPPADPFGDRGPACEALARRDKALARALAAIGGPHVRRRAGGFEGLFRIIVEQQVSVPSAQAIWKRCGEGADVRDAGAVAALGEEGLRRLGLSTPKARYVIGLASALRDGSLHLEIAKLDDAAASAHLQQAKGVGPWTAAIYLLFCEGRCDVWPPNDIALLRAYEAASGRKTAQQRLDSRAANWAPHRGVAAHILWTYYAHLRGRAPI